eukprot:1403817-Rhodomonas_salina.1
MHIPGYQLALDGDREAGVPLGLVEVPNFKLKNQSLADSRQARARRQALGLVPVNYRDPGPAALRLATVTMAAQP